MAVIPLPHRAVYKNTYDLLSRLHIDVWMWLRENVPAGRYQHEHHAFSVSVSFLDDHHFIAFKLRWA